MFVLGTESFNYKISLSDFPDPYINSPYWIVQETYKETIAFKIVEEIFWQTAQKELVMIVSFELWNNDTFYVTINKLNTNFRKKYSNIEHNCTDELSTLSASEIRKQISKLEFT